MERSVSSSSRARHSSSRSMSESASSECDGDSVFTAGILESSATSSGSGDERDSSPVPSKSPGVRVRPLLDLSPLQRTAALAVVPEDDVEHNHLIFRSRPRPIKAPAIATASAPSVSGFALRSARPRLSKEHGSSSSSSNSGTSSSATICDVAADEAEDDDDDAAALPSRWFRTLPRRAGKQKMTAVDNESDREEEQKWYQEGAATPRGNLARASFWCMEDEEDGGMSTKETGAQLDDDAPREAGERRGRSRRVRRISASTTGPVMPASAPAGRVASDHG